MRIRHLVGSDNLDAEGFVAEPLLVRHGLVVGGQVAALAGPIDPLTHLNLDFADHALDSCLVAERLEVGAAVLRDGDRFREAFVRPAAFAAQGPVRREGQLLAWQRLLATPGD